MGNPRRNARGQRPAQGLLAPAAHQSPVSGSLIVNSNLCADGSQKALALLTLYIFKLNGRPVAMAFGDVPPDPGPLVYDSLLRIPVVRNGDRPAWRAFEHNQREPISRALARSEWPDVAAAPAGGGDRPKRRRRKGVAS